MKNLKSLGAVNVQRTDDIGSIQYTSAAPSEDSVVFSIQRRVNGGPRLSSSWIVYPLILCLVAVGFSASQQIPHEELRMIASMGVWLLGIVASMTFSYYQGREVVSESILAVKGVGLQLFSETRNGSVTNLFLIELNQIREILIVEGFSALKVITYIAVEVAHGKKPSLVIPFRYFELPTRISVEIVKGLRRKLCLEDHPPKPLAS
jgi:hypothetical protein